MTERSGLDRFVAACRAARLRVGIAAVGYAVVLVGAAILALSLLPEALREGRGSVLPLVVALALLGAVGAGARLMHRLGRGLVPDELADEADAAAGLGAGDVRGALELGGRAGSADLAEHHRRRIAARLEGPDDLLPGTNARWSKRLRGAVGGAVLAAAVLGVSAALRPGPTTSAALALGAPWRTAFPAPLPALVLTVEAAGSRETPAVVSVQAAGRDSIEIVVRPAGDPPDRMRIPVPEGDAAIADLGPIASATRVWAEDDYGGASDTALLRPREPLLVQDLRVRMEYPAYLGREPETLRGQIPPLVVPEGTRIVVSGETNHPLTSGELEWSPPEGAVVGAAGPVPALRLDLADNGFSASFVPRRSGRRDWRLEARDAVGDPILPAPLRLIVVPDLEPAIQLLFPAPDTLLGPERVMPIVVDVEDDIGLRSVQLRSWRSGLGAERAERRESLAPSPDGSRRAVFRHLIDRSAESLIPGDTIFYRFEAFDGAPRGPALSDVYLLRVPTFTEVREARAEETRDASDAAAELEDAMQRLSDAAADAARRVAAEEGSGAQAFEATEEARAVLDDAEAAAAELAALEEELEGLSEDVERSPVTDEALAEQLATLAERYEELMESGLSERIEELAEALRDLDPEAVREALEQLAGDSERMREQLEQTLGMLDRAAIDQAMKSAAASAEDLADEQRELAENSPETAGEFADEQERIAERAAELAEALEDLEQRLSETGQQAAADSAASARQGAEEARRSMEEAAGASEAAGETGAAPPEQSRDAAAEAAEAMEQASEALGGARQDMAQADRDGAAESLGRARSEALALAEEEGRLAEATRGDNAPETWRARQNAVRQGLENLLDRLSESGNESAMLDQETGAAAGDAAERMDRLLQRLAEDGARRLPSRAEAEGIQDALNQLAMRLLAGEQAARAEGQQTQGQEAAEQMSSLAQQQQAITQETSSLLMPGPQPSGQERTEEVSARQQEIAEQLRDLEDPEGELLGRPEELAREAEELARDLSGAGPTQETLERQRRLFQRMLDAGRSLEDEDLDPNRRESTTGTAVPRDMPEIDLDALRGRRFPLPPEALLRDLPIFYRPLIFEYFDRLNRVPERGRGTSSGRPDPPRGPGDGGDPAPR